MAMRWNRLACAAIAATIAVSLGACSKQQGGQGGAFEFGSPGAVSGTVGFVDMDAIVATHPLHSQLQAMQDQISVLQQVASAVPTGMNPQQSAAYDQLQRELAASSDKFQQDLGQRRALYEKREAGAISKLQASALGSSANSGGVLGGLQQQYGAQAQALQKQAFATFNNYRDELFRQDGEHLKSVQQLIAADMRGKLKQRESELSSTETKYSISLVKADQEQRLNLQTRLQNLALSDKDRKQYQDQLNAIDANEQSRINALKARDNAEIATFEKGLNAQAASEYAAERSKTQAATQAKLVARQREMQTAMSPQMQALSGKFQQQLNDANAKLANNQKYKAQALDVHNQMQTAYMAEANTAEASYRQVREQLVAKYSAIAHMQFQDNEAIAAQADKLAADRHDLYQKIVDQVQAQITQIAQKDGVAIVFTSIRGAGTAVDLTAEVRKAINSSAGVASQPVPTSSGGS